MTVKATMPSLRVETNAQLESHRISFRSILVATDLSEQSKIAVKLAARLAKQFHSNLYVLYAVSPEIYFADTAALERLDLEAGRQKLHDYARRIGELRTVKHEELVICSIPQNAIERTVADKHIDLLVVASHGRQGLGKLVLGSVAEWAIRHLHRPIFVTGPKCNAILRPQQSILYATDMQPDGLCSAQYASSLAQEYNAEITFLHVAQSAAELSSHERRHILAKLHHFLPNEARDWCTPHFEVITGDVADVIPKIAALKKATMIVLGARRGVLAEHAPWSTLSKIITSARCPVLVVPCYSA